MKFRPDHLQHVAAAKAGFSERTARRIETNRHLPAPPNAARTRQGPDPFDGLWDSEIRPLLEAHPGLRPVAVLEEMQRRHPDHDLDRLRCSLERRAWQAQHGCEPKLCDYAATSGDAFGPLRLAGAGRLAAIAAQ